MKHLSKRITTCLLAALCVVLFLGGCSRVQVKQDHAGGLPAAAASAPREVDVFTSGQEGYAFYRIPALLKASDGTLLAFAEGRVQSASDTGAVHTVLRRSTDSGATWGPLQMIWSDGNNTCGNPAPVLDASTGRIWVLGVWNLSSDTEEMILAGETEETRRIFVSYSDDAGLSWSDRREITANVKPEHWRWYATGPGHGVQLSNGRLLIPANHSDHSDPASHYYRSHVIVSDNHGKTWRLGGTLGAGTNESTAVELPDGRVMMNMRSYHGVNRRAVAWSGDGGGSFGGVFLDPSLVEPICQGSILRVNQSKGKPIYLFSNPASTKREKLTIRLSEDGCETWSGGRVLHEGFSAYSDLCALSANTVACLYERDLEGKKYGRITFASFAIDWLRE